MKLNYLNIKSNVLFSLSIFLILALLLSTNNGSVAIAGATVFVSFLLIYSNKEKIKLDRHDKIVIVCLSAYTISNLPMTFLDWDNFRYFRGASRIILCVPIYFSFKYLLNTKSIYIKPIIWGTIVGCTGAFLLACYQHFVEGRLRVDGFLFSINFGYLACSLAVLALALLRYNILRPLLLLSFLFASIATLMTLTRGAIFVLPIVLALVIAFNIKRIGIKSFLFTSLTLISLIIGSYFVSPQFQNRVDFTVYEITSIINGDVNQAASTGGRLLLWRAAFEAFKERPTVGLTHPEREALNKELANEGVINDWAAGIKRGHAHSQYFDQLASGGLLGIVSVIFTLAVPFGYFFRFRDRSNAAYVGCLFVFSFALFCLTEVALQQNLISTFYGYMLALFFAATQLEVKDNMARVETTQ
ncbi:O-antigen ligase family protein [Vibrio neptunius]|uniref:O-antigen ligase family protein n=1 Tax=Vibrio neptunius TaxID=170651 RepID=A0ABS3A332_9VIBR|nr:O-antigen ligase family protein [Vibrio neptunius]MBN3493435.1 O-antigen ligase family protein [Vibrio neptunius]MBN3515871.1 O-antigen ligase family protein [Vibrio neptunius]MBN3550104.1 O-antigen ligase family protein [Vibrio neptunius]MBN3578176.1 O-antigen ligase family protein [Vibrio neptunius]MCH9871840.1 O-antigen ligase family protein [Vibrio neptunius]